MYIHTHTHTHTHTRAFKLSQWCDLDIRSNGTWYCSPR